MKSQGIYQSVVIEAGGKNKPGREAKCRRGPPFLTVDLGYDGGEDW
jgi:hypothetical protein